jgi:hypothetical protein
VLETEAMRQCIPRKSRFERFAFYTPVVFCAGMWLQAEAQPTARETAPIDLAGYWVSIVSENWRLRMVTPPPGDYLNVPLNDEGRRVADTWDPDRDEREGLECKAYGAPFVMRMPVRIHITWEDDNTLRIETDAGQQTRLVHFGAANPPNGETTWQGRSVASWQFAGPRGFGGFGFGAAAGVGRGRVRPEGGSLIVTTTHLRPGYLRWNGVPYSENAVLTEHFDRHDDVGEQWITHTRIVEDPTYLTEPWVVTSHFKREPDDSKWNPTPCEVHRFVRYPLNSD